jgi:ppGpp synthetase/RelA/SpoT-type nucleotidyltranferase
MSSLTEEDLAFHARYLEEYGEHRRTARVLEDFLMEDLRSQNTNIHLVRARAKSPKSLLRKLRVKEYSNPDYEVTDLIAARAICYFEDDVDSLVTYCKRRFNIDEERSVDKRSSLGLREFGYRSVHLIVNVKTEDAFGDRQVLGSLWFELQVRSVLEHAWAEIEHEIRYKSGVEFPAPALRRLSSLAGVLEMLDREFVLLRQERSRLVEMYKDKYTGQDEMNVPFDVARLMAFLEVERPDGLGWRQAEFSGQPLQPESEVIGLEALKAVGLTTPAALKMALRGRGYRRALENFAVESGIRGAEVSHQAVLTLVALTTDSRVATSVPELMDDPIIARLFGAASPVAGRGRRPEGAARRTRRPKAGA